MGNQGDTSEKLARSAAKSYQNQLLPLFDFRSSVPPTSPYDLAQVKRDRQRIFATSENPLTPLSAVAMSQEEQQAQMAEIKNSLRASESRMRQVAEHEQKSVAASRTVGQAMLYTLLAIAIIALAIGLAYLCHMGATAILSD
ncbi:MAG: hypothetical protein Q4E11_09645 [Corynebacterium sp.]|uniref:hypothetical protein n=1 Tax=Corynebacterium sp. TaxID=1720 RepID=UPI0026DABCE3|nr:hypothetical protein [Corynebacterium sp.]MDO5030822.1 hypothetical protein [Corynebacterium sp.]